MGWISALFAHKVVRMAGADDALLQSLCGASDRPTDPEEMIPDTAFFELLEQVAHNAPSGRDIGVRVGASVRCDEYGVFGLAFKSAVDLAGSFSRVERYGRVVTSIANFRVVPGERTSFMEVIPGYQNRLGMQMTVELALAAAMALSRQVSTAEFSLEALHVAHAAPVDRSLFEDHFGCPIRFDAERDALEVSNKLLLHPNRLGDVCISHFFDAHLDRALSELPVDGGLERRVRSEIAQALSEGVPTLSQTAQRLAMSGRTLQRRLADAGLAYQKLAEEARRDLATRLLRNSDYTLVEIAFLTGFSEQSTFTRAFKRWHKQTPRAYRLSLRS